MNLKHPMELFIKKLIILGKIHEIEFHREMGKFYGYPKCCINNYIRVLYSGQAPAKYMHDKYGHRHTLGLVLCNECHGVYQEYVGYEKEIVFV